MEIVEPLSLGIIRELSSTPTDRVFFGHG
jgi:hypothetical protein